MPCRVNRESAGTEGFFSVVLLLKGSSMKGSSVVYVPLKVPIDFSGFF